MWEIYRRSNGDLTPYLLPLVIGICFWFTSKLMFQALMGLLLAIILIFNMLGALLIIPGLIALFKPRFILGK